MDVGLAAVSALLEQRGGGAKAWALSEDERKMVGPPTAALLAKYAGSAPASVELAFAVAWASYALPRLLAAKPARKAEPRAADPSDERYADQPVKLRAVAPPAPPVAGDDLAADIAAGGPI